MNKFKAILFWIACLSLPLDSTYSQVSPIFYDGSEIIDLSGDWNFVLNDFLSYEDVIEDTTAIAITVPSKWNDVLWEGEPFSGIGFGTYYQKIELAKSQVDQQLSIYIPEIALAYSLFLNDKMIGNVGVPGTDESTEYPRLQTKTVYFTPPAESFYMIVHVSNFRHQNGGFWYSPKLGTTQQMHTSRTRTNTINLFLLGGIFIMGFHRVYHFSKRKNEPHGGYFFLVCLCLLGQLMSKGEVYLVDIFPSLGWRPLKIIEYVSFYSVAAVNMLFIDKLFEGLIPKWLLKSLVYVSMAAALFTIFFSPKYSALLVTPFQFIALGSTVYLIWILIRAVQLKFEGAIPILVGISVIVLTGINDLMQARYWISSVTMIHYGMFVYVITLSIVVSKRFTDALNKQEELQLELENTNLELEDRVSVRTAELKKQQELVAEQNEQLKAINEEQKQFTALVAHDLKSPLTSIIGLSGVMKDQLKGELKRLVEMISKIAWDGNKVIENIVELRNYETAEFEIATSAFDLGPFVHEICARSIPVAEKKHIRLMCETLNDNSVITDEDLLRRIVDNLLSNAIKFSPPGTCIHINLEGFASEYQLSIKDEGPGFSKEDKLLVFGKFQKLSARPTGGESSSGLGLSIVKKLVDSLGAKIELKSEPGQGAEFIIRLPKSPDTKLSED